MKFFLPPLLLAAALVFTSSAQSAPTSSGDAATAPSSTLILQVKNVRNRNGVVRYILFASPNGWPDDKSKAARYGTLPANGGTVTFTIGGLQPGSYAISVLHDENQNHKLDRDLFGRPKEGIGFGNNPKIGFSSPNWKQSIVHVAGASIESTVDLRYP